MSVVAICNRALNMLGANTIISLDDGTTEANACKLHYAASRDAVLESHEWSFAIKRRSLVPTTSTPEWGNSFVFQLPSDCLRVLEARNDGRSPNSPNNGLNWTVEGNKLICDSGALDIRYLARIEDTTVYSPKFNTALSARLAADMCVGLTESTALQQTLYQLAALSVDEAKTTDGLQGSNRKITYSRLTRVRYT